MMANKELEHRFKYHAPDDMARARHETIRDFCGSLADDIDAMLPDCREKSLAITKVEEAMFWANAAIARNREEA